MVRCRLCKVSFKSTGHKIKKCWRDFDMCYTCAVINHPEAYPKNIIFANDITHSVKSYEKESLERWSKLL